MSDSQQPVTSSPFVRQWEDTRSDVLNAVDAVGKSGWYILGERVRSFERKMATQLGRAHAVGCASGLDAIELALRVLGLRPGDYSQGSYGYGDGRRAGRLRWRLSRGCFG